MIKELNNNQISITVFTYIENIEGIETIFIIDKNKNKIKLIESSYLNSYSIIFFNGLNYLFETININKIIFNENLKKIPYLKDTNFFLTLIKNIYFSKKNISIPTNDPTEFFNKRFEYLFLNLFNINIKLKKSSNIVPFFIEENDNKIILNHFSKLNNHTIGNYKYTDRYKTNFIRIQEEIKEINLLIEKLKENQIYLNKIKTKLKLSKNNLFNQENLNNEY